MLSVFVSKGLQNLGMKDGHAIRRENPTYASHILLTKSFKIRIKSITDDDQPWPSI